MFDITTNWKMFKKEFKTWLADAISNITLLTLGINIINLHYMKNKPFYFIKLRNGGKKESHKTLKKINHTIFYLDNNNKYLSD